MTSILISCHQGKTSDSEEDNIKKTIHNALSWVYGHPANFAIGGFIEISEEIITFYIVSNNTENPEEKRGYIRQIEKRLELIKSNKEFKVQHQEYTMFLAVAAISEKLGLKTWDFRKILEDQILSDPLLYPPHMTSHIWDTVYMARLGYNPPKSMEQLLPQSTLSKEVQQRLLFKSLNAPIDPMFIDPISITIYDITHEIFALTDFGELPPPPVILENHLFFLDLFDHAIQWAINVKHIDILAELIMCAKILDLKNIPSLKAGIEFLVSAQQKDGSFGVTNPGRPNVFRHGILVSIMALSMV